MTTFVVPGTDLSAMREVRLRKLGDFRPASTLVVVQALARPEFLIEIEAIAARS